MELARCRCRSAISNSFSDPNRKQHPVGLQREKCGSPKYRFWICYRSNIPNSHSVFAQQPSAAFWGSACEKWIWHRERPTNVGSILGNSRWWLQHQTWNFIGIQLHKPRTQLRYKYHPRKQHGRHFMVSQCQQMELPCSFQSKCRQQQPTSSCRCKFLRHMDTLRHNPMSDCELLEHRLMRKRQRIVHRQINCSTRHPDSMELVVW